MNGIPSKSPVALSMIPIRAMPLVHSARLALVIPRIKPIRPTPELAKITGDVAIQLGYGTCHLKKTSCMIAAAPNDVNMLPRPSRMPTTPIQFIFRTGFSFMLSSLSRNDSANPVHALAKKQPYCRGFDNKAVIQRMGCLSKRTTPCSTRQLSDVTIAQPGEGFKPLIVLPINRKDCQNRKAAKIGRLKKRAGEHRASQVQQDCQPAQDNSSGRA